MSEDRRSKKVRPVRAVDRLFRGELISQFGRLRHYVPSGNQIRRRGGFEAGKETVLLMQGYVQTRGVLDLMESRLRRDGFQVFSFHLGGFMGVWNTRDIKVLAQRITRRVARFRARYQLPRLHMIGHSKGGLVGRAIVQLCGGSDHIQTLVTLGTPHQGTPTAIVAALPPMSLVTEQGHQMMPGSSLVQSLGQAAFPPSTRGSGRKGPKSNTTRPVAPNAHQINSFV